MSVAGPTSELTASAVGSVIGNPYYFTGRRLDILDGGAKLIQINRHRHYDYRTGRWLSVDPLGVVPGDYENAFSPLGQYADGGNLLEYVGDNPVEYYDPLGTDYWDPYGGLGGNYVRDTPKAAENFLLNHIQSLISYYSSVNVNGNEVSTAFYPLTGFKKMLEIDLTNTANVLFNHGGIRRPIITSIAHFDDESETVYLPEGSTNATALHELVHAYLYLNGIYPDKDNLRDIIKNEGIAYASEQILTPLRDLRLLEREIYIYNVENNFSNTRKIKGFWKLVWSTAREGVQYNGAWVVSSEALKGLPKSLLTMSEQGLLGYNFTLGERPFEELKKIFGFKLSCRELAEKYNSLLKYKGNSCYKFVCHPSNVIYEFGTEGRIPDVFK